MKSKIFPAIVIVAIIILIFALGGGITRQGLGWYGKLELPAFTSPGWVISSAWTLIYLLTGIAAWRVWMGAHELPKATLAKVAVANVILNVGWSAVNGLMRLLPTAPCFLPLAICARSS